MLDALQLPVEPDELLAAHARTLDEAWRHITAQVGTDSEVTVDDEGRLHASSIEAIPDPPSLTALRQRCEAMLPRVDIGELVLEVMSWHPRFVEAFTAVERRDPPRRSPPERRRRPYRPCLERRLHPGRCRPG